MNITDPTTKESRVCVIIILFIWLNDQVTVHSANQETSTRLLNGLNDKSRCQIDRSRSLELSATHAFQVAGHFLGIQNLVR